MSICIAILYTNTHEKLTTLTMPRPKQKQLNIRINEDLLEKAQEKCDNQFGISLSALIKIFLKAFISQRGVGFYIGDDDICQLFHKWLSKQSHLRGHNPRISHYFGPFLKDLYNINK